ncbi:plasmid mobilization protein [Duganella aceris]|uniref:plasmid mobilization protein n=1 Tax=Duganella aceris TaxID=2703883 RepID=UPI003FCD6AFA
MMKNTTRKNSTPVKVYCLPEEHEKLKELSAAANLSMSNYLRKVGLGYGVGSQPAERATQALAHRRPAHCVYSGSHHPRGAKQDRTRARRDARRDAFYRDATQCPEQVGPLNAHERCHGR